MSRWPYSASTRLKARIKQAAFGVHKDFDTYDFTAILGLNKQKVMELARGEWIEQHYNCCLIGSPGTGKTHLAIALGLAACWVQAHEKPYDGAVRELLGIPEEQVLVAIVAVGTPFEEVEQPAKRSLEDVIHWEKF